MKMKDLNEKYGDDDFGLRGVGSELDNDERGMAADYTQIASQAAQFSDLPKGGTIETTDGQQVEVTQDEAKFLARFTGREVARLYDLFGVKPAYGNDPDAMEKAQKIFASSKGLMAVMNKVRK
jgi:hypothetical protein